MMQSEIIEFAIVVPYQEKRPLRCAYNNYNNMYNKTKALEHNEVNSNACIW